MEHTSFGESQDRWATTCAHCGQPCDGQEEVKELAMGHVMHHTCYEKWIERRNVLSQWKALGKTPFRAMIVFPEEKGLTTDQIRRRRHAILMRLRRKKP